MDFRFDPEEERFRQEVHAFIEQQCPPQLRSGEVMFADQIAHIGDWRARLVARGLLAPAWPKKYGGAELSVMQQFIYNIETARMAAPAPIFVSGLGVNIVGPAIILLGNEEQRQEYIPDILAGTKTWCQGFSEPGAGSDLASLTTRALRDGDEFVVNGQKIWTSLAHQADYLLLLCRTDPDAPKHKGLSYLIVPMTTPGITVRPLVNMAGSHEFNEVFFEDVRVPARNLMGELNRGWYGAVATLDIERSNIGHVVAQRRTVEDLLRFVGANRGTGVTSGWGPAVRAELAERYIETEVSMMMSFRVVTLQKQGKVGNTEASANKLFSSEVSQRIALTGMRVTGLYGQLGRNAYLAPNRGQIEYRYVRAVSDTIAGGTSEIQRNIIATRGLGLPR